MKANRFAIRPLKSDNHAIWEILMGAIFIVIIIYAVLNIGTFINGTISDSLMATYPAAASRTATQNTSIATLGNVSTGYDTSVKMSNIAVQIAVITLPLLAVVAIRKFI